MQPQAMPHPRYEDVQVGMAVPPLAKVPSRVGLAKFAGTVWFFGPLHLDREFAVAQGLPDVNVNGPILRDWIIEMITDWLGPSGQLTKLRCEFRGPAYPGDRLTCEGRVKSRRQDAARGIVELEVWINGTQGQRLVNGEAEVVLQ